MFFYFCSYAYTDCLNHEHVLSTSEGRVTVNVICVNTSGSWCALHLGGLV
jgi:hypothetical protein